MDEVQIQKTLNCILGYWPQPSMTELERHAFKKQLRLLALDSPEAIQVVESMARSGSYKYRPQPMEFAQSMKITRKESKIWTGEGKCTSCDGNGWILEDEHDQTCGPTAVIRCARCTSSATGVGSF